MAPIPSCSNSLLLPLNKPKWLFKRVDRSPIVPEPFGSTLYVCCNFWVNTVCDIVICVCSDACICYYSRCVSVKRNYF